MQMYISKSNINKNLSLSLPLSHTSNIKICKMCVDIYFEYLYNKFVRAHFKKCRNYIVLFTYKKIHRKENNKMNNVDNERLKNLII